MQHFAKHLFLILFSCFFLAVSSAQEIDWQKTIGGSSLDWQYSIKKTFDGGFICGGMSESGISGNKTQSSRGYLDYWIVKFDSLGNISWQQTIGGDDGDYFSTMEQTSDGGYILGGWSKSNISGEKTDSCRGYVDYWVVKTDAFGIIEWQKTIGGASNDFLYSVKQTADGGFIAAGYSASGISGDKSEGSSGAYDIWLVKLDSYGNIIWQNTIGGDAVDYLMSLSQTTDGGYICGGSSSSNISGDKSENTYGSLDFWVVKINGQGNVVWQKTIGGAYNDLMWDIITTNDHGFVCAGWSDSNISGNKTENNLGGNDCWVVKIDSLGNIQWQNNIGGVQSEWIKKIKQTSNGNYICAATSFSDVSGDKTTYSRGNHDYWIFILDSLGNIQWQNTLGGTSIDQVTSLDIIDSGDYLVGGYSDSEISGDKTDPCIGNNDFWLLKLTGKYNIMKGTEFADFNANFIRDSGEPAIPNKMVIESTTGRFDITDSDGFFSISILDSGNFVALPSVVNYFNPIPGSHSSTFNGFLETDSLNDFAFQPTGTFNDLCLTITPTGLFRAGMNATYKINYTNSGTTTLSPTVIFYPDNDISYVISIPSATTITPDSIVFTFGPISPFQSGQILITINVNLGLPIGTLINSGAVILPVIGDANPACNTNYWEVLTTGSLDPNDILVNRDSLFNFELVNPESLEYIIRFQNTGNDTAFYVRIDNKISADLQINTFEFVATSHPCNIEYQNYDSTMKFTFNNILLPDSNINESASHGFVRYKIKPQTSLLVGDSIRNSAGIYFDYNAPVWTNTAVTEIVLSTGLSHQEVNDNIQLLVYPNPVDQVLSVEIVGTSENNFIIDLYNMYGQKVNSLFNGKIPSGNRKIHFDVSELRSGMYFIKAEGSFSKPVRFIKY